MGWTYERDAEGKAANSELRPLGYLEVASGRGMPQPGDARPIPSYPVQRPASDRLGIGFEEQEQTVPQDAAALWQSLRNLRSEQREHFLEAGSAYQAALSLWPDHRTAYAAFMVVACEALKPAGKRGAECNIYDVVEGLLGIDAAQLLRQLRLHPQRVRNRHLHRGELAAGELVSTFWEGNFGDPSFTRTAYALSPITRACLFEWLRLGGRYALPRRDGARRSGKP